MPSLQVRDTIGIHSRRSGQLRVSDMGRAAVKHVQATGRRARAIDNDFIVVVRNPAVILAKSDKGVPI